MQNKTTETTAQESFMRNVFDWIQTFAQAIFIVVLIFTFCVRFITVDGKSMTNTLSHGDRLLITANEYTPNRGDIVVIHDTEAENVQAIYDYQSGSVQHVRVPAFRGPIIKRVIATAGETVVIDYVNRTITVTDTAGNVRLLDEPYVRFSDENGNALDWQEPSKLMYPQSVGHLEEHVVADGCVFVCGDNRNNSLDSRYIGDIGIEKVLGKALIRVFPISEFGLMV